MHIQLSLSLHFYLLYLLSDSFDGNNTKRVFLCRLLVALKTAGCVVCCIGDDPLVSTVSGHPQFLALWCPPIGGHPQNFQPSDR